MHHSESKDTIHSRKTSQQDYTSATKRGSLPHHELPNIIEHNAGIPLPRINLQKVDDADSFFSPRGTRKANETTTVQLERDIQFQNDMNAAIQGLKRYGGLRSNVWEKLQGAHRDFESEAAEEGCRRA